MTKPTKQKKIDSLWLEIVKVGALLVLVVVVMNFGYFVKQVSAWLNYDLADEQPSDEVVLTEPNQLAIPSIGLTAPLVYVDKTDEVTFQRALERGVVHYPGTANVGEMGNAYFFGHSSDYTFKKGQYKTVFATLPKVAVGDKIFVTNSAGKQFSYEVVEKKIVQPNDVSVLEQQGKTRKLMTLQTSYPLGTALRRYLVVCEAK